MGKSTKQLAIIGATASGKSALGIAVAKELGGIILSIDSLSIYREIDISSAKPAMAERGGVEHYGIDILSPNEPFDVSLFIELYKEVREVSNKEGKPLIIVGGTSFYLKMLIDGISPIPILSSEMKRELESKMQNPIDVYSMLYKLDSTYMSRIAQNDPYRIEKALGVYLGSGMTPSEYFRLNPPISTITDNLPIYEIDMPRDTLRSRIKQRTEIMIESGLIDEVRMLDSKYGRKPNCMKAIGIKETLAYLDDEINEVKLSELISIHTGQLAKRQTTFNRSQFSDKFVGSSEMIREQILGH